NQWKAVMGRDLLLLLSADDSVKWIQQGPLPFLPLNDQVRGAIQADTLQGFLNVGGNAIYSGLDGTGITVAVIDSPLDADHDDFWEHDAAGHRTMTRLLLPPPQNPAPTDGHGTHVAGTIASNGYQSDKNSIYSNNGGTPFQWRGVAPHANLLS